MWLWIWGSFGEEGCRLKGLMVVAGIPGNGFEGLEVRKDPCCGCGVPESRVQLGLVYLLLFWTCCSLSMSKSFIGTSKRGHSGGHRTDHLWLGKRWKTRAVHLWNFPQNWRIVTHSLNW